MTDEEHPSLLKAFSHPPADNDNLYLLPKGWAPSLALSLCRQAMKELRDENSRTGILLRDVKQRARLADMRAYEACLRWHYFRALISPGS